MNLISVVGMPLRVDHLLFNCAVVFRQGKILGIIPKTFLPNYREFYEYRQFAPAAAAFSTAIDYSTREKFLSASILSFSARSRHGLRSLWRSARISGCRFRLLVTQRWLEQQSF